jgi:hypothetical protein
LCIRLWAWVPILSPPLTITPPLPRSPSSSPELPHYSKALGPLLCYTALKVLWSNGVAYGLEVLLGSYIRVFNRRHSTPSITTQQSTVFNLV